MTTNELIEHLENPELSWNDIVEELILLPKHYTQDVAKELRISVSTGDNSCLPEAIASYIKC